MGRRIKLDDFPTIRVFNLEGKEIHSGSSKMSVLILNPGETSAKITCDFQIHLVVLEGEVSLKSDDRSMNLKQGCLASMLPDRSYLIQNESAEKSEILLIQDDPLWVLKKRRSVRKYSNIPVPKILVEKILNLSRLAPSGGNVQPWRIFAISDQSMKDELAKAAYDQNFLKEAPWVIVVCAVPEESAKEYGERGKNLYSLQDTAALTTYIMLAAKAYGLDTCWVGAFKDEEVIKILNLQKGMKPVSMIPIGYGEEEPDIPPRKPLDTVLNFL